MFRYGNKPIEEGQNIVFSCGTVKPKPWTRWQERRYHWRHAVGWMGNFIFFGVGLWYMSAIALCYGRAQTDLMLEGWVTSTCISWCVIEPLTLTTLSLAAPTPRPYPSLLYPSPLPFTLALAPTPQPAPNQVHHGAGLHHSPDRAALHMQ